MLNRSQHPLAFTIDVSEFTLAPKAMHQLPFSPEVKRIVVKAEAEVAGRREAVIGNPLPVRPGRLVHVDEAGTHRFDERLAVVLRAQGRRHLQKGAVGPDVNFIERDVIDRC